MGCGMGNLLDESEAGNYLKVGNRALQAWRLRGEGPKFIKVGRLVRYSVDDLDRYVESRRRQSTAG